MLRIFGGILAILGAIYFAIAAYGSTGAGMVYDTISTLVLVIAAYLLLRKERFQ